MPAVLVLWAVAALLVAAALGVALHRARFASRAIYLISLAASLVILVAAGSHLLAGAPASPGVHLPVGLPWIGAHFRIDALSAFFLVVTSLGGAIASLYAIGYGEHEEAPGRVLPFYPAFLAGMTLVVLADDAFTFLLAWEFMSLSSWALVMAHHHDADNRAAGYIYIVMASFGTLTLLLAFGLLAGPDGGYTFDAIRRAEHAMPGVVLLLMMVGAGSKAGLVPLHVWLPLAHPAAPSHVSALMSGVMTKVAVYGFVRVVFDLLGSPGWWWSSILLTVGGTSAVLGVLSALMQRDLKRLLAFSTIENIGIVFIGLGLALAFKANGMAAAAALALTAALLHAFNHSLFKSLLFFGAGAVLTATGERDIEKLGGLIRTMPQTAFLFLGGCLAISALPPLNGFVSEWLTFQAVLLSPALPQWVLKLLVPAIGAVLALGAALSAACFVRAFGIAFLGRARTPAAAAAHETDRASLAAMGLCLAALPRRRHPAGPPHRPPRARRAGACRRAHAAAVLPAVALDRPRCREPQLLQRPAAVPLHPAVDPHHDRGHPPLRLAPGPPQPALGLRLPRSQPCDPIHRRQLLPAHPPRVRHARVPRLRARRHAPARRYPARAPRRQRPRYHLGDVLCAHLGPRLGHRRAPQPPAVPQHPPVPEPGVRRPRRPAHHGVDMAPSTLPCRRRTRDAWGTPAERRERRRDAAGRRTVERGRRCSPCRCWRWRCSDRRGRGSGLRRLPRDLLRRLSRSRSTALLAAGRPRHWSLRLPIGLPWIGAHLSGSSRRGLPRGDQSWWARRACTALVRSPRNSAFPRRAILSALYCRDEPGGDRR